MMTIWIVYAHTPDGERFALAAYEDKAAADAHKDRCTQEGRDSRTGESWPSPAQTLGLSGVTVVPLAVVSRSA
jgi:hypothetical protein